MFGQMKQDCSACSYMKGMTGAAVVTQFDQDHMSVNQSGAVCAVDPAVKPRA